MTIRHLVTCAALVVAACTVTAAEHAADARNPTESIDKFRTYAWAAPPSALDPARDASIVAAIERQLELKRLTPVAGTSADLYVSYRLRADRRIQVVTHSAGWGPYAAGSGATSSAAVQNVVVATLSVELRNADTRVVWRGKSSFDVDPQATPQAQRKRVDRAVERLLKSFPRE